MVQPETCPWRSEGVSGDVHCRFVERILGVRDTRFSVVEPDACTACCQTLAGPGQLNPVTASLAHRAAGEIADTVAPANGAGAVFQQLQERLIPHLEFVHPQLPDRLFPPPASYQLRDRQPSADELPWETGLRWQAAVLTAPRPRPEIANTLESLHRAGFDRLYLFAEPGSWVPPNDNVARLVRHRQRLGNFANFYYALTQLYRDDPSADCFAVFQDDIRVARGAKSWCDQQFWPLETGLVSLFTPRVHCDTRRGWRSLYPGYYRVYGGQALVFRGDVLQRFLADPQVLQVLQGGDHWDDCTVAGWAVRHQIGMAYHSPSLVQHVGHTSSLFRSGPDRRVVADAIADVAHLSAWRSSTSSPGRIGLIGWNTPTGLGYQNGDIACHLQVAKWLIPVHPEIPSRRRAWLPTEQHFLPVHPREEELRNWLRGLDWILFVERPYLNALPRLARQQQVAVACVANWEWLQPNFEWLKYVELMICPTRFTHQVLTDWKRRYGFGWELVHLPWPIDSRRFKFRPRTTCRRFLFVNGWGGGRATRLDGTRTAYGRKGIELVVEAARMAPHCSLIVYSQADELPDLPPNVERRAAPRDNRKLYRDGDVCVQPSHWEGLGLQLLECQAAGLPLITTDAPPMNEMQPLDTIPVSGFDVVHLCGDQPIAAQTMRAEHLAAVLRRWQGADLGAASRRARDFVAARHSWSHATRILQQHLVAF